MKGKLKGFTLIEVVISMAISAVVLTVITTFFITNTNTLAITDIKSTLQQEGENIKEAIVKSGTQSNGITNISIGNGSNTINLQSSINYNYFNDLSQTDNSNFINQIDFTRYLDPTNSASVQLTSFQLVGTTLSMQVGGVSKVLSNNVDSFTIKPSDAVNLTTQAQRTAAKFNKAKGIEVIIVLKKKKGANKVEYPISMNIVFRNMDVTFG